MNCVIYFVLTSTIFSNQMIVSTKPAYYVNYNNNNLQSSPSLLDMIKFMRKFGYLEPSPSDSEALYQDVALVEAIKNVQKFGALKQTGIIDAETARLLIAPRCGVTDVPNKHLRNKRYVIGSKGWQKRNITYFIANWSGKLGRMYVERKMKEAFNMWARYGHLRFIQIYDPSADIIVGFATGHHGDNNPFDGPGNILAHAFYPYEMSSYGGDIHFDDSENWKDDFVELSQGVNFLSVATHELGHSLGLSHSPVYTSIMFPYYKGASQNVNLDYDDVLGMYKLYQPSIISTTTGYPTYTTAQSDDDNDRKDYTTFSPLQTTFIGDYETVEKHKKRFGITNQTLDRNFSKIPDLCGGNFDAVSVLRGELCIFKDEFMWTLTKHNVIKTGFPIKFSEIFVGISETIKRIDAVYERQRDNAIVLFTGTTYWIHDGYNFIENSPRPISDYGLGFYVKKIDAAIVWAKNQKVYLFSGHEFWRYNEFTRKLDDFYPRSMNVWKGIPNNVNAAATMSNGKTIFFKGDYYWLFNNIWVRSERGYPRKISHSWLNCSTSLRSQNIYFNSNYN